MSAPPVLLRAAWVLPIVSPPIRDGWLLVRGGRVAGVGAAPGPDLAGVVTRDLGAAALLPGLVNAHTHLELSGLRGRVPPAPSMPGWVCDLLAARRPGPPPPSEVEAGIREARRAGTALVGDVSNTLVSIGPLEASGLTAVVFHELLGFSPRDAAAAVHKAAARLPPPSPDGRVRTSLAVHAPYSSSPALFREVRRWIDEEAPRPTTVHLGESIEEIRFLHDGGGPWRTLLEALHAWDAGWRPPGCGPVEYLERVGFLGAHLLVVHGVHLEPVELERLAAAGATVVTCPRSNRWVGAGDPPVAAFYASGVTVAVGTDSLASVADLNVFADLAALRRIAPSVPARRLLESATHAGAAALGFGGELGLLAAGARAEVLAVDVPAGVTDVEEYLLTGIQPSHVRWVEA